MPKAKHTHPFQGSDNPVFRKFVDVVPFHPLMPPQSLPLFLHDYWVVRDTNTSPDVTLLVHTLYHSIFDDLSDRKALFPAIKKGVTIAILNKDKSVAISGITFVAAENACVILYVATEVEFQSTGMATFLLSLASVTLRGTEKINQITMYLKVNQTGNPETFNYYKKRGYTLHKKMKIPTSLIGKFEDEVGDSPFSKYFECKDMELQWMQKKYVAKDSKYVLKKNSKKVKTRFFPDPNWMDSPSTYAYLPGTLGIQQLNHCAPDFEHSGASKLKHSVFYHTESGEKQKIHGCDVVHLSWSTRCLTKKGEGITSEFLQIVISWLKRYPNADIWMKYMTIIPIAVMDAVRVMEYLFVQYRLSMNLEADDVAFPIPVGESEGMFSHIFHPVIDFKKFMTASSCVLTYILSHKDLFRKPYIAMLTYDDTPYVWSCFISYNAGNIRRGNKKDDTNSNNASNDCGYLQFDPYSVTANDDEGNAKQRELQYTFFLKLAYHVCYSNPKKSRKLPPKEKWVDDLVAPWFQTMKDFESMFRNEIINFGYVLQHDSCRNDIQQGRFRTFELPKNHPVWSMPCDCKCATSLASFVFLLEFCICIKEVQNMLFPCKGKNAIQVMAFNNVRPNSKERWDSYLWDMQVNMIQLVDRIASAQLGSSRLTFEEYTEHLIPMECVQQDTNQALRHFDVGLALPDLSSMNNWKQLLRKPRAKDKKHCSKSPALEISEGKRHRVETLEDTSEEDSLTPRTEKRKRHSITIPNTCTIPTSLPTSPKRDDGNTSSQYDNVESAGKETMNKSATTIPHSISEASFPFFARRPGSSSVAQHSTTDVRKPYRTIPMNGVSTLVRIFEGKYKQVSSEQEKVDLCFEVFKYLHFQNQSAIVSNVISRIRSCFDAPEANKGDYGVANELDEMVEVRIAKDLRPPRSYTQRTSELKEKFDELIKSGSPRHVVLDWLYWTLRNERLKFVHQKSGEAGRWDEMYYNDVTHLLNRRMGNLKRQSKHTPGVSMVASATTSLPPTDEQPSSPVGFGPAPKYILGKGCPGYKGHPGNMEYRKRMAEYSPYYEGLHVGSERKEALIKFLEKLQHDGFTFVNWEAGIWKGLDDETKIRKNQRAFADHARGICKGSETRHHRKKKAKKKNELHVPPSNPVSALVGLHEDFNPEIGCSPGVVLGNVALEAKRLTELETGPHISALETCTIVETNNAEGTTHLQMEDRTAEEFMIFQPQVADVGNVLAHPVNSTQETYIFHDDDATQFSQTNDVDSTNARTG